MLVVILADPVLQAVVPKWVVVAQVLAADVSKLVVILADPVLAVLLLVALKQLVVILVQLQLAIAVAARRRSIAAFSPSFSDANPRSLAMKVHAMHVQLLATLARLQHQQLFQQKQLPLQHQLQ